MAVLEPIYLRAPRGVAAESDGTRHVALTARVIVDPMRLDDVAAVHEIEELSFRTPWPAYAFEHELKGNRLARYLVARAGERIVAFAGVWLMVDDAHITTFGVHPDWRRQGIGRQLLLNLAELSLAHRRPTHDARGAGLERGRPIALSRL